MMSRSRKILAFSLVLCLILGVLTGCGNKNPQPTTPGTTEPVVEVVDYASQAKLNMNIRGKDNPGRVNVTLTDAPTCVYTWDAERKTT